MKNSRWDELVKRIKAGVATRPETEEFVRSATALRVTLIEAINCEYSIGDTWDQDWPQLGWECSADLEADDPEDPIVWLKRGKATPR